MNNFERDLGYAVINGAIATVVIASVVICFYAQEIRKDVAEMKTLLYAIEKKMHYGQ